MAALWPHYDVVVIIIIIISNNTILFHEHKDYCDLTFEAPGPPYL